MAIYKTPAYSLHKATGQARIQIQGRSIYLGKYGTRESRRRYHEIISRLLSGVGTPELVRPCGQRASLTVAETCELFMNHAMSYYRGLDGKLTGEVSALRIAVKMLCLRHGALRTDQFGPRCLKEVQQQLIDQGYARSTVNNTINRCRRIFRWAVSEELVQAEVSLSLQSVTGVREGYRGVHVPPRRQPVDPEIVRATMPHLTWPTRGLIHLMRLTGMRPTEACIMRMADIDTSVDPLVLLA